MAPPQGGRGRVIAYCTVLALVVVGVVGAGPALAAGGPATDASVLDPDATTEAGGTDAPTAANESGATGVASESDERTAGTETGDLAGPAVREDRFRPPLQRSPMEQPEYEIGHVDEERRERIAATDEFPHAAIVHVDLDRDQPGGSGVLVEPDVVVTAAHVVDFAYGGAADITVQPGRDGNETPYGSVQAEAIYRDERYEGLGDFDHDFALIELEEPIGAETGTFDVQSLESVENDSVPNVTVTGYPHDRPPHTMWEHTETLYLQDGDPHRLGGVHETWRGQSGSPYWTVVDGEPTVLGVYTHGVPTTASIGNGTGIDDHRVELIETVTHEEPADPVEERAEFEVALGAVRANVTVGQTVTLDATVTNVGNATGNQSVRLTVDGAVVDEAAVELDDGNGTTVPLTYDGDANHTPATTLTVSTDDHAANATIAVTAALPALGDRTRPPRDLNGDDLYRDVTADGELTTADVRVFQRHLFDDVVQDHVHYYDFTGSGTVSHGDVIALFRAATGVEGMGEATGEETGVEGTDGETGEATDEETTETDGETERTG